MVVIDPSRNFVSNGPIFAIFVRNSPTKSWFVKKKRVYNGFVSLTFRPNPAPGPVPSLVILSKKKNLM
jgi:hypothetical protein